MDKLNTILFDFIISQYESSKYAASTPSNDPDKPGKIHSGKNRIEKIYIPAG